MSGLFAVPLNLRTINPHSNDRTGSMFHDGHGLSKPPDLECHAFAFVISSSGFVDATEGTATVAAYNSAVADEEVMVRKGTPKDGGVNAWALEAPRLLNSRKKERIERVLYLHAAARLPGCLVPRKVAPKDDEGLVFDFNARIARIGATFS